MSDETRSDAATSAQFDMRSPTHHPHLFPANEHTAGQSTAEALQRSRQLYPGRLSPEQRELRDQVRAEQRVAKLLQRLTRVGARVLHDRRLPHSAAQLDHLVISASGVYLLSAVAAGRHRPLRVLNGDLAVGDRPLFLTTEFTYRAATQAADAIAAELGPGWNVVVYPQVVVVGAELPPCLISDTEVGDLEQLPSRLTYRHGVLDPVEVALLAEAAARACPPAGT